MHCCFYQCINEWWCWRKLFITNQKPESSPWQSGDLHIWTLLFYSILLANLLKLFCISRKSNMNQVGTSNLHQAGVEALILAPEPGLWSFLGFESLPHWKIQQITPVVLNQTILQDLSQRVLDLDFFAKPKHLATILVLVWFEDGLPHTPTGDTVHFTAGSSTQSHFYPITDIMFCK